MLKNDSGGSLEDPFVFPPGSQWTWVDGSAVRYENWEVGQPDTSDNRYCTEMHGGAESVANQWRTSTCDRRRGFACKVKKGE